MGADGPGQGAPRERGALTAPRGIPVLPDTRGPGRDHGESDGTGPTWARPRTVLVVLLGLTLLRVAFLAFGGLDLSPDEAHYWEWSRHLDWSYYSKGPLIAWLIAIQTAALGTSALAIRIGAVLLSVAGAWMTYRLGAEAFGDPRPGALAAIGLELTPMVWAGSLLMTIDAPFLTCWVGALWCLHRALRDDRAGAWLGAGLAIGLGTLAKYTMLFVVAGLALYLWRAPEARRWLRRPAFWCGAGVAALSLTPVVAWNLQQGWVTVRHVARQGRGDGVSLVYPAEFLASQVGVLSPIVAALLLWGLWVSASEGLGRQREPYRFLVAFAAPVLVFYGALSIQGKVQANWAAAAYPSLALATAGLLVARRDAAGARGRRTLERLAGAGVGLALLIVFLGHVTPWLAIPRRLDPTNRLRGWAELGSEADRLRAAMPRPRETMLLSDQYQITSEMAFYVSEHPPAYNLRLGRRLNQYDLWEGPATRLGWDALYVEEGVRALDARVMAAFDRVDEPLVLEIRRAGRTIRTFSLHRGYGFRGLADETAPARY